ncbi:MAG: glycosyl transferase family 90 [Rikenellaceae bacterium]
MGYLNKTFKRSRKKNNKLFYHISSLYDLAKPKFMKRIERKRVLRMYEQLSQEERERVDHRIAHYNRLAPNTLFNRHSNEESIYKVSDLKLHATFNGHRSRSNYCYDSLKYLRCYDRTLKGCFVFGDVTWTPEQPSFVKSRPIEGDNSNSVLLALNRIRHFNFINDKHSFDSKLNMLIGISYASQENRQRFLKLYFNHPKCRLGSARQFNDERKIWNVDYVSINEQLEYKFILCLEGYDVATNLKWVMSSNSIAVMTKPKYETWFMESTLIGGIHYIEIADDFSDLEEKLQYYIDNPIEAHKIIEASHKHIDQFRNKRIEHIISMKVVENYFNRTNQLK